MLTLTRKVGQRILIGKDIEIVVREVRGRQVRIGIIAPPGVDVFREEVAPAVLLAAAGSDDSAPVDGSVPSDDG